MQIVFAGWAAAEQYLHKGYPKDSILVLESLVQQVSFEGHQELEVRTLTRLGQIYLKYTDNTDEAKRHLQRAEGIMKKLNKEKVDTKDEKMKPFYEIQLQLFKALAKLYMCLSEKALCVKVLQKALEFSTELKDAYWREYFRLLLFHTYFYSNDEEALSSLVEQVNKLSQHELLTIFYYIVQGHAYLCKSNFARSGSALDEAEKLLKHIELKHYGSQEISFKHTTTEANEYYLYAHYLILRILCNLRQGKANGSEQLKQLQECIKHIKGNTSSIIYEWVDFRTLVSISYILAAIVAQINGESKSALKRANSATTIIQGLFEEVKSAEKFSFETNKKMLALITMYYTCCETKAIICMTMCDFAAALGHIRTSVHYLSTYKQHMLPKHRFHLHLIIGTLAYMMGEYNLARQHFSIAASCQTNNEVALWAKLLYCSSQISEYHTQGKLQENQLYLFEQLDNILHNESSKNYSSLLASISFLRGVLCVGNDALQNADQNLKAALEKAHVVASNQLTANILLEQGSIFAKQGKNKESLDVIMRSISDSQNLQNILLQIHQQLSLSKLEKDNKNYNNTVESSVQNLTEALSLAKSSEDFKILNWLPGTYDEFFPYNK